MFGVIALTTLGVKALTSEHASAVNRRAAVGNARVEHRYGCLMQADSTAVAYRGMTTQDGDASECVYALEAENAVRAGAICEDAIDPGAGAV